MLGGPLRSINARQFRRANEKVTPPGHALPDVPEVTISDADIDRALGEWDQVVPARYRTMLDATVVDDGE